MMKRVFKLITKKEDPGGEGIGAYLTGATGPVGTRSIPKLEKQALTAAAGNRRSLAELLPLEVTPTAQAR